VIVNERLARQYWPDQSPIGRSMLVRFAGPPITREIIGIVADAKRNLAQEPPAALYIPHAQNPSGDLNFIVHTSQEPAAVVPLLKAAIQSVAPVTGLGSITTLDTLLDGTLSPPRFILMMVGFFAAAALLVGAIGTYGVIAYSTAERTKEIGIRLALGGGRRDVIVAIMGDGIRIASIGVIAGLLLAASVSRLIADMLYGITPVDWPAYAAAAIGLSAIALIACAVPAWRAARLDPLIVLRTD
jgi:putative ABC transport system permease protein